MPELTVPSPASLSELASLEPATPVLSVHLRTDPRDPANTNHHPAWHIDLRNGLRDLEAQLEDGDDRDGRLALRELAEQLDTEISALEPSQRARSISLFLTADRDVDITLSSQLPLQESVVRWDRKPFISPLVDVVDRGRATGLVLVDGDEVHLLHWEGGHVSVPENNAYALELNTWHRSREGSAGGGQSRTTISHHDRQDAHEAEHRSRFLSAAASAVETRLPELGWERIVVVAAPGTLEPFLEALPEHARGRVIAQIESHITGLDPQAVGEHLEEELLAAWQNQTQQVIADAIGRSRAGGAGATGVAETLDALSQGRVAHLVYDPALVIVEDQVGPQVTAVLGETTPEMLLERVVEHAIETDATVSALPGDQTLQDAGGIVAVLRW